MTTLYAMTPQKVNSNCWTVVDAAGEEKASAVRDELTGLWTAYLNPRLGAWCMNYLSFRSDNPASALNGLLTENINLAKDITSELEDINTFMDLRVIEDEVEKDALTAI